jgi:hypothetical protein
VRLDKADHSRNNVEMCMSSPVTVYQLLQVPNMRRIEAPTVHEDSVFSTANQSWWRSGFTEDLLRLGCVLLVLEHFTNVVTQGQNIGFVLALIGRLHHGIFYGDKFEEGVVSKIEPAL